MTSEAVARSLAMTSTALFFGAALYISRRRSTAWLEAGVDVALRQFPHSYRRAARLQASLAVIGSLAGVAAWLLGSSAWWAVSALLLFAVVPRLSWSSLRRTSGCTIPSSRPPIPQLSVCSGVGARCTGCVLASAVLHSAFRCSRVTHCGQAPRRPTREPGGGDQAIRRLDSRMDASALSRVTRAPAHARGMPGSRRYAEARRDAAHGAMAAASGVTRADGGKGLLEHRIVPLKPMTGDVELLYGDPDVAGQPFVMRIRELPQGRRCRRTRTRSTSTSPSCRAPGISRSERVQAEAMQELKAGSYAFAPKGSTMFGFSPDGAVVQVHGVGPFHIHWKGGLHTLDDADAKTFFRLVKGAQVSSERGAARIVQGYASGRSSVRARGR